MSAIVKLAAKTPIGETVNGLDSIAGKLLQSPESVQVAVIWFNVQKITESFDAEGGRLRVPTVQVTKIEPLGVASGVPDPVVDVVLKAAQARLGQDALPFEQTDPDGVEVYATGPEDDPARKRVTES